MDTAHRTRIVARNREYQAYVARAREHSYHASVVGYLQSTSIYCLYAFCVACILAIATL